MEDEDTGEAEEEAVPPAFDATGIAVGHAMRSDTIPRSMTCKCRETRSFNILWRSAMPSAAIGTTPSPPAPPSPSPAWWWCGVWWVELAMRPR